MRRVIARQRWRTFNLRPCLRPKEWTGRRTNIWRGREEIGKVIAAFANFSRAIILDGQLFARLQQDEAAKAKFTQFVKMSSASDPGHARALRFVSRPELARAKMPPAFSVTTMDGNQFSMGDLQGIYKGRLCCSIFGPRGASPAVRVCRIAAKSPRS